MNDKCGLMTELILARTQIYDVISVYFTIRVKSKFNELCKINGTVEWYEFSFFFFSLSLDWDNFLLFFFVLWPLLSNNFMNWINDNLQLIVIYSDQSLTQYQSIRPQSVPVESVLHCSRPSLYKAGASVTRAVMCGWECCTDSQTVD